ncbi:MAG: hypothetical protein IJF39_05415 [Clostridia bacterium]|nr:hypothetical protein [Clostridia bacterium]
MKKRILPPLPLEWKAADPKSAGKMTYDLVSQAMRLLKNPRKDRESSQ